MVEYQQECENHAQTVDVLRRLKEGELSLDSLTVTGSRWAIVTVEVSEEAVAN